MKKIAGYATLLIFLAAIEATALADVCVYSPPKVRQVRGDVVDSSGRPIPGVTVFVTRNDEKLATSKTDQAGRFVFPSLQVGEYEIHFVATGFQRAEYKVFLTDRSKRWNRFLRIVLAVGLPHCGGTISVVRWYTKPGQ